MKLARFLDFSGRVDAFEHADGPPPKTLYAFCRWALRGSERMLVAALLVSMLVGLSEVLGSWLIGWLVDYALAQEPERLFDGGLLFFLGAALFFVVLRPILLGVNTAYNSLSVGANYYPLILSRVNRYTLGQSLSFFNNDYAGRIAQKAQQTSRALTDVVMEGLNIGGVALASLIGALVIMAAIHPALLVLLAVWALAWYALIRAYLPRIRERAKRRAGARAGVTGQIVDTITNISTVKLFAHGAFEDEAALGALGRYREAAVHFGQLSVVFRFWLMTLAGALPVLMIGGAFWLWTRGLATPGDITAASLIATRLGHMTGWVSFTLLGIFSNIGEIEDGIRTLTPDHAIVDRATARDPGGIRGRITFRDISFGYGREGAALSGFNLDIAPGEKVGLVGRSGAGKSTAVSLLLRLYDVEDGAVLLDGTDIRDFTQDGLRKQIAMVTQDTATFNRPAMENIRYGRPDATDEEVEAAARQAEAHDFIQDLRDFRGRTGYAAHLGERGVKLSGGQRQRIALARAILKDAPVLVLDEATSALDSEVEAAIQETLYRIMEGKTVIAIAHRLSTIARMDRIVVMDEGRIVEEGTHGDLLARRGLYADFWGRQSGGFLGLAAE